MSISKASPVASSATSVPGVAKDAPPDARPDFKRKVLVMGSRSVGKSSLTSAYVQPNSFNDSYYPTIENAYTKMVVHDGLVYECEIIDTAGQDEYSLFNHKYAVGIHGYILVYSIASRQSFELITTLYDKILDFLGGVDMVCCVIVGQKSDLNEARQVRYEEGEALAKKLHAGFIETSAKDGKNIAEVFTLLLSEMRKVFNPRPPNSQSAPSNNKGENAAGGGNTGWWASWFGGAGRTK